jgi:hypothetical protein
MFILDLSSTYERIHSQVLHPFIVNIHKFFPYPGYCKNVEIEHGRAYSRHLFKTVIFIYIYICIYMCIKLGLLDYIVVIFLIFWDPSILFYIWLCQFIFLPTVYKFSFFSTFLPILIFWLFDNSHLKVWGDISLWFWFAFLWCLVMLTIFLYFLTIYMSSVENCLCQSLAHFQLGHFIFCCWVVWVPYTFWVLAPYQIYNLWIFSHIL